MKKGQVYEAVVERVDFPNKGIVRSFEPVYLMHKAAFENNPTDYCRNILGLTDPSVIRKVKINSLLSLDGFRMHLSKANSENDLGLNDANQLVLEPSMVGYIKKVIKFNAMFGCKIYKHFMDVKGEYVATSLTKEDFEERKSRLIAMLGFE